jgi:hypothetical protein
MQDKPTAHTQPPEHLENMAELKYLGRALTNKNVIRGDVERR